MIFGNPGLVAETLFFAWSISSRISFLVLCIKSNTMRVWNDNDDKRNTAIGAKFPVDLLTLP